MLIEMTHRNLCVTCLQPDFGCYCSHIQVFDPRIRFVILIHPIEYRRRIATGRMAHLSLKNSRFIVGQDYTENHQVNSLLQDSSHHSVLLYPGPQSINLSMIKPVERAKLFPAEKSLTVFVVDGTWATAKKMVYQSQNLKSLPRLCFSPPVPSRFQVRKQPGVDCYSTIEAIHHTLELIGEGQGFDVSSRKHDALLATFQFMVNRQLEFIRLSALNPHKVTYRRDKNYRPTG